LQKIRGRGTSVRTSLYVHNTVVLWSLTKRISATLLLFFQPSERSPVFIQISKKKTYGGCLLGDIDLDGLLSGLPVTHPSFLMMYLGLPLSVWHLKRVDFQPLEDKMAGKLVT
jgi:hypothetical protein